MRQKQKGTRTQIVDLAEIAVELSESEMRIVSGGISVNMASCTVVKNSPNSAGFKLAGRTQYITGGDWDTD